MVGDVDTCRSSSEFGMVNRTPVLACDCQSVICLAMNIMFYAHTKHIDVWYHFIREILKDGMISYH